DALRVGSRCRSGRRRGRLTEAASTQWLFETNEFYFRSCLQQASGRLLRGWRLAHLCVPFAHLDGALQGRLPYCRRISAVPALYVCEGGQGRRELGLEVRLAYG